MKVTVFLDMTLSILPLNISSSL